MRYSNIDKVGEKYMQIGDVWCECIEYVNSRNISVVFLDKYRAIAHGVIYSNFKKGTVKNPYYKSVSGVGYLGEGFRREDKVEAYSIWQNMISRCYKTREDRRRNVSYLDCVVCEEWHNFQNFIRWYENALKKYQSEENFCIDKDLINKNNKKYCPEFCCLLPNKVNIFLTTTKFKRGEYPIGVYYDDSSKKYRVQCCDPLKKRNRNLGRFDNIDDAFIKYKQTKELYAKELADRYNGIIDDRAVNALINFKVEKGD